MLWRGARFLGNSENMWGYNIRTVLVTGVMHLMNRIGGNAVFLVAKRLQLKMWLCIMLSTGNAS